MFPNIFTENNNSETMLEKQQGKCSPTHGAPKGSAEGMNMQAPATSLVQLVDQEAPRTEQKQGKGHGEDYMFDLQVEELFHGNQGNQDAAASQVTQQQGAATSNQDPFQASANSSASILMNFTTRGNQDGQQGATALAQNHFQAPETASPHMLNNLAGVGNESSENAALFQLLQYQIMQLQQQQLQEQQQLQQQLQLQQLQGQSAQLPVAAQEQQQENNESTGEEEKEEGPEGEEPEKPKRSLSAYNIFFQTERKKLLKALPVKGKKPRKSHGKIGFAEMARTVAAKWKSISPEEKVEFQHKAAMDKERYKSELIDYQRVRSDTMLAGASGSSNSIGTMRGYASQPSMANANPATIQTANLAANIFMQGLSGNQSSISSHTPGFARDVSQSSMAPAAGLQSGLGQRQSSLQSLTSLRQPSNQFGANLHSFPSGNSMHSLSAASNMPQPHPGNYSGLQRFSSETSLGLGNTYQSRSASSNTIPVQVSNPAFQAYVRANSNSHFSRVNSGSFSSALNYGTGTSQNATWGNPTVSRESMERQQRADGEQINFFMNMLRGSSAGN